MGVRVAYGSRRCGRNAQVIARCQARNEDGSTAVRAVAFVLSELAALKLATVVFKRLKSFKIIRHSHLDCSKDRSTFIRYWPFNAGVIDVGPFI